MEPEKRYSIPEENSVSLQSILLVGDQLKKYLGNPIRVYPTRYRKNYYKYIKILFIGQMLSYSWIIGNPVLLAFNCFRRFGYRNKRTINEFGTFW